jgi:hypothetical protein
MYWARLPVLLILVVLLGCLVEDQPGAAVFHLADAKGTIAVPTSLEGWQLRNGAGNIIATGHTRLHLAELEMERTTLSARCDLGVAVTDRHREAALAHTNYIVERRGEFTRIGEMRLPTSRATYDVTVLGQKVRMVQEDLYFLMEHQWVRLGLRFPAFLEPYFWTDIQFIVSHVRLAQ